MSKTGLYSTAWKSVGSAPGSLKSIQYVSVDTLETVAKSFLKNIKAHQESNSGFAGSSAGSYTNSVYTKDLFTKLFSKVKCFSRDIELSSTDMNVLLKYLSRDLPRLSIKDDTIKINLAATSFANIEPVSEQDRAVAALKQTIHDIAARIDGLSTRIEECDNKAKTALASKSSHGKTVARYALRSRKLAQTTQVDSFNMLANLEQTLTSIDTATSTVDIMASLKQGVGILSTLNQSVGGAEKVAELVDELQDNIADTDEISREISSLGIQVDEAEIDDEFEQLLAEENKKKNASAEQSDKKPQQALEDVLKSAPLPPKEVPSAEKDDDIADKLSSLQLE